MGSRDYRALFLYAGTIGHASALETIIDAARLLRDDERLGSCSWEMGPSEHDWSRR